MTRNRSRPSSGTSRSNSEFGDRRPTELFFPSNYDVLRAVEFLRSETDADRVTFLGEGTGAYHALYAAVTIENVERIDLHGLGSSFYERATGRDIEFHPQLLVFDVVGTCAVSHLISALELRDVHITTTSNGGERTT